MKRNKRFQGMIIIMCFVLLFSGCGLQEKIGEGIAEKLIESASDGEVNVDLDDGNFSISSEDGEFSYDEDEGSILFESEDGMMVSGESTEWPEGDAAEYLPELKDGTIAGFYNDSCSCIIWADEVSLDEYKDYVDDIKDEGYTENTMVGSYDGSESYYGENEDGIYVTVSYIEEDQSLQIGIDTSAIASE